MRSTLEQAKRWCALDEGEYTNDPDDPGGPTRFGITLDDYRPFFKKPQATAEDIRNLTIEDAFRIYEERYWGPCGCDLLPIGVDYFTFDSGLLSGVGTARRWLQRAVGAVPDGILGPKTFAALAKDHPLDILAKMEALRRMRLRTLPGWRKYGRGWTNRVNKSIARAKKLVASAPDAEALANAHPTPAIPTGYEGPRKAPISPAPEEVVLDGHYTQTGGVTIVSQGGARTGDQPGGDPASGTASEGSAEG